MLLVLGAAGCSSPPGTTTQVSPDTSAVRHDDGTVVLVPSEDPRGGADALTSGTLVRLEGGCLGLRADDGSPDGVTTLVRWPYGTTWDPERQELSVARVQPAGEPGVVRLGDLVSLGGGFSGAVQAVAGCRADGLWSGS